jgi:hypothetical protein
VTWAVKKSSCPTSRTRIAPRHEEKSLFPQVEQALEGIATRELAHAMMKLYLARVEAGYPREWS